MLPASRLIASLCLGFAGLCEEAVQWDEKTKILFAGVEEAGRILARDDSFIRSLSPFDRAARLKSEKPVGKDEFLSFASAQARAWDPEEASAFKAVVAAIRTPAARFRLPLPERIHFVKTTGKEEGQAAYCRGNAIVVPQRIVSGPSADLEALLLHEFFHVFSRNNPASRERLYHLIGFRPCGPVALPADLRERKITNPDAPVSEHCIDVAFQGGRLTVVPVLFAREEKYSLARGGEFFAYLTFKLLVIEKTGDGWQPKLAKTGPQLLDVSEVQDFFEQVGRNTEYLIHPEEILADNFSLLVRGERAAATPEIIERMRKILMPPTDH